MKKSLLLFIGLSLLSTILCAQQLPQFSQYLLNKYITNPASAGENEYFVGQTNFRAQWTGIRDAPRTYILSANGRLKNQNMGVGGYLFSDITGPIKRNGFNLSYAYHLNLNENLKLSLAINAGVLHYTIDGTEITFHEETDRVRSTLPERSVYPDAGFSFYLYSDNYFFGASSPQLLQNKLDFKYSIDDPTGRLINHYFITGGYTFQLDEEFDLQPSALLKYVNPVPLQYEFSLRGIYRDMAWLGFSYRKEDAVVLLVGYTLNDKITFGYAHDFIQSGLQKYSKGTHEIMLSYKFLNPNENQE